MGHNTEHFFKKMVPLNTMNENTFGYNELSAIVIIIMKKD